MQLTGRQGFYSNFADLQKSLESVADFGVEKGDEDGSFTVFIYDGEEKHILNVMILEIFDYPEAYYQVFTSINDYDLGDLSERIIGSVFEVSFQCFKNLCQFYNRKMPSTICFGEFQEEYSDFSDNEIINSDCEEIAEIESSIEYLDLETTANDDGILSASAARIVQREIANLVRCQMKMSPESRFFSIDENSIKNLSLLRVKLINFDKESGIGKELDGKNVAHVELEIQFGSDYPTSPPFVRVVWPRFCQGGFIMQGGGLCTDILTLSGWSPAYCLESLLLQLKMLISDPNNVAKLSYDWDRPYGRREGLSSFIAAVSSHSWEVPTDKNS